MRQAIEQRPFLQRSLTAGLVLLVIASLLFLGGTLSAAEFKRGVGLAELLNTVVALFTALDAPQPLIFSPIIWKILSTGFWLLLLLIVAFLLGTREGRRELPKLLKYCLRLLVFVWVLFFLFRLDASQTETSEVEPPPAETSLPPLANPEIAELANQVEEIVVELPESPSSRLALVAIGILFAFGSLLLLRRSWRYRQELKALAQQPVDELRARALQSLTALRQGEVPLSDVIRRCYREMTQTVQEQRGVYRERSVTPREFESRLMQIGLPQPPVQRLTRLFEQVRYGNAATSEREKREAIDCLERIVVACEQLDGRRRP